MPEAPNPGFGARVDRIRTSRVFACDFSVDFIDNHYFIRAGCKESIVHTAPEVTMVVSGWMEEILKKDIEERRAT